jgi:hypothetical protein
MKNQEKIGYLNPERVSINICDLCLFHKWLLSLGMVELELSEWTNVLERKEVCYTPGTINSIVVDSVRFIWDLCMLCITFIIQIKLVDVYTSYIVQQVAD